ncbi:class I SAM-dependent methyltransferase [Streptomyces beihaiensis]|uniref:Methyltransferase domain-containing protein n=1 Tax=Streptomyces beihaiensis TaxID=2984495 RepID=A0ABT3U382_9ACTN|nr:methyltransferase domain-containing protein [Streptomyces beihaiensis]MCX3063776.1 methyltransferase domain-containing protein [Streptomyces beihaiensis]
MNGTGDVGAYYDALTPLLQQLWGGNFHIGLWPEDHTGTDTGTADGTTKETAGEVTAAGDRLTDLLIGELSPRPDDRVLDVGCGIGHPALRLARATGARVTGVTISTTQVDLARSAAEGTDIGHLTRFQYADATALPYPDRSFEAAWAIETLLHIGEVRRALAEIRRVLLPGSAFVISDMILRAPEPGHHEHSVPRLLTQLLALLSDTGFHVETVTDLDAHLRHSLHRLDADLDRERHRLHSLHGPQGVDALTRILRKTIPGIGQVFGYTVITTRTAS